MLDALNQRIAKKPHESGYTQRKAPSRGVKGGNLCNSAGGRMAQRREKLSGGDLHPTPAAAVCG